MNTLELIQTVGICTGAIALAIIAFVLFLIAARLETMFSPFDLLRAAEDFDDDDEADGELEFEEPEIVVKPLKGKKPKSRR